jgi:peptide/nickel transport system substrate-binding protein
LSQLNYVLGTFNAARGIGAGNYGRYSSPALDALLAQASVTLDDGKRAALLAQSYELALGRDVATIPMLFPITAWGMRKDITYGGFPQEATVASLIHKVK